MLGNCAARKKQKNNQRRSAEASETESNAWGQSANTRAKCALRPWSFDYRQSTFDSRRSVSEDSSTAAGMVSSGGEGFAVATHH
jgi:hypothetical protein